MEIFLALSFESSEFWPSKMLTNLTWNLIINKFKPGSCKNIFPKTGFVFSFLGKELQILIKKIALGPFSFALVHNTRSLRLSNTLHSRFYIFKKYESKTQNKPETILSPTLSGLRNKNNHINENGQLPHWKLMLGRHYASTEQRFCVNDS